MTNPEPVVSTSSETHLQLHDSKHPTSLAEMSSANLADSALPRKTRGRFLIKSIFLGPEGLRASWSFLLFVLLLLLLSRGTNEAIRHFHLLPPPSAGTAHQPMSPRHSLVGEAINFVLLVFASFLMSLLERRPFARYGLGLRRALKDFATGLFWGFLMLSLLIGVLLATHSIAFDGVALHGTFALTFAVKWALVFLFVGLFEEFFTRGYIQFTLARGVSGLTRYISPINRHTHAIGFWVAAFLFSVCLFMFGHIHNSGETYAGIAAVGLAGAVFAFSLYRTGTLWWAIGMHAAWDWAQTFFYGVSDSGIAAVGHLLTSHPTGRPLLSGGATGPEGSLFVIPTLLLLAVVIHYTLPRRPYPLTPAQTPPAAQKNYQLSTSQLSTPGS